MSFNTKVAWLKNYVGVLITMGLLKALGKEDRSPRAIPRPACEKWSYTKRPEIIRNKIA